MKNPPNCKNCKWHEFATGNENIKYHACGAQAYKVCENVYYNCICRKVYAPKGKMNE